MLRVTDMFLLRLKGNVTPFVGFLGVLLMLTKKIGINHYTTSDSLGKICSAKTISDFMIAVLFVCTISSVHFYC